MADLFTDQFKIETTIFENEGHEINVQIIPGMAKVVEIYNNKKMAPKYISEKKAQKYIDKLIKWGYTRTL
jgi:hypothetical protein